MPVLQLHRQSTCQVLASSQQPSRAGKAPKSSRTVKLVPALGTSVKFIDVLPHTGTLERTVSHVPSVPSVPSIREEHLTRRQKAVVKRLCIQLQVAPQVGVAITAQAPFLADQEVEKVATTMRVFAEYFGMSLFTLGRVMSVRPDFVANPQLLQTHITKMSSLLSIHPFDLPLLLSTAPELVAYSPSFFTSELQGVASLLQVEGYEAAALVRLEPRILIAGSKRLTERLEHLSSALSKPYPAVAAVVRAMPSVLFLDMKRLQKKWDFLEEVCSSHPSWQQQLSELPLPIAVEILRSHGVHSFMRLRFLAQACHQPSTDLTRVFAASTKQFEQQWPEWPLWSEWNTPSYLFE